VERVVNQTYNLDVFYTYRSSVESYRLQNVVFIHLNMWNHWLRKYGME